VDYIDPHDNSSHSDSQLMLDQLIRQSSSPLGPPVRVDLGVADGPLAELAELLSRTNGVTAFNGGVQVFRADAEGIGPELGAWNAPDTWKDTYAGLADGLYCFGQDLFGVQFAIEGDQVVEFDPETGDRTVIGNSLDAWAQWLLEDPDVNGAYAFASAWQEEHGALEPDERLIPLRLFVLGGEFEAENLVVKDAVTCMRIRGPLAQQLHDAPDGTIIQFTETD
jgi:hypothetical protein